MKRSGDERLYRIQEFAELAGVTVRALHHYDRIHLLQPKRTGAGYRLYTLRDLERLEQIVALKFLGLSLKQIQLLLDRDSRSLSEALRMQREVLEHKRCLLNRAIDAIREAESTARSGRQTDAAALKKIIEVIGMQENSDWMLNYQSDSAKEKIRARQKEWTPELQAECSRQWLELIADVEAALGEDPASEKVQALADRWTKLIEGFTGGDRDVAEGVKRLYADKANWPAGFQEQARPFLNKDVCSLINRAIALRK